ncbi:MAG: hypothetical protein AB7O70_15185 [Hyphomicrobiales bacterium]
MFGWLKGKSAVPEVVKRAGTIEYAIRDAMDRDSAEAHYRKLAALAQSEQRYPDLRRLQANGALNLMRRREQGQTAENLRLVQEIRELAATHPGEGVIRECFVLTLWECIARLLPDERAQGRALHEEQKGLFRDHAEVRKYPYAISNAAGKLIIDNLVAGDIPSALELYEELKRFADDHPGEAEVRDDRGGGGLNIISRLTTVDDMGPKEMEMARDCLKELESYAGRFPRDADLQEHLDHARSLVE